MNPDEIRAKNAERKRKYRQSQSPKQKEATRIADMERHRKIRLCITPEKCDVLRAEQKSRMDEYRKSQTPEQRSRRLELELERVTTRRLFETKDETEARRQTQAERESNNRKNESEEETEARRQAQAERERNNRKNESEEETEARRQAQAERERNNRKNESEEETEARRQAQAERERNNRKNESEEETEARRQAQAERERNNRKNESEEETEARRQDDAERKTNNRKNESEEETEARRQDDAERKRNNRKNESEEETEVRRQVHAEASRKYRLAQAANQSSALLEHLEDDEEEVPDVAKHVNIDEVVKSVMDFLRLARVGALEKDHSIDGTKVDQHWYQANVCIICDEFICGTDSPVWLAKEKILKNKIRLSNPDLPTALSQCYQVEDEELHGILLSPRARCRITGEYVCCKSCSDSLKDNRIENVPPKFAIANGWAIGTLPEEILDLVTEVTGPLLAIVRPFAYVMSYRGGAHKSIKGSITFFSQDVEQNVGSLHYHSEATRNSNVYVVLAGRFTPDQRNIIRQRCLLHVDNLKVVFNWLKENNCHYAGVTDFESCPRPQVVEDMESTNNTDESVNSSVEKTVQFQYWFPSLGEPNSNSCTFNSESEFLKALLTAKEPTMIYSNNKTENDWTLTLPKIFPLYFPFGVGGIKEGRANKVSDVECMRHYLRLSLPQFQKSDFILVLCQMYLRKVAFQSAYVRVLSRSCNNGVSIANSISSISDSDIMNAAGLTDQSQIPKSNSAVGSLLRTISTSCRNIPHMDEAAKLARTKMFGLWVTLGPPSLFFTISPCDECSFRVQLFASPKPHQLPGSNINKEECVANLFLRSKVREDNPGACAREFKAILDLIIECLLGWDVKKGKQKAHCGIFGKVKGWSIAIEEQGRKTLHAHMLLYIELFNKLITLLWSSIESERQQAQKNLISYLQKVMSSSYDISESDFSHEKNGKTDDIQNTAQVPSIVSDICMKTSSRSIEPIQMPLIISDRIQPENRVAVSICRIVPEIAPIQKLHQMRNKNLCMELRGKIASCQVCQTQFTSKDLVWNAIRKWYSKAMEENEEYFPKDLKFPLTEEQLDLYALRYSYDMMDIPEEQSSLRKMLVAMAKLRFNEHDFRHRMSCFKKSCECRFLFPKFLQDSYDITFQEQTVDAIWYKVLGLGPNIKAKPFTIETPRNISDLFLNTHNPIISKIFGYNSNVMLGSHSLIYYSTLYNSKGTQKEEKFPFLVACNAIAKRIRWRKQQQELEDTRRQQDIDANRNNNRLPATNITMNQEFKTGLGHVLSGIMANISTTITSAPMAWFYVMEEDRFMFSHDMVPLLLSQAEDWLNEKEIQFRFRQTADKIGWLDSTLWNYRFRPMIALFQDMCLWEFTAYYEPKSKTTAEKKKQTNEIRIDEEDDNPDKCNQWEFSPNHPGRDFICIKKRKIASVPMLYYKDELPDMSECKIDLPNEQVSSEITLIRNEYATKALLLFHPFREVDDFPVFEERWDFFAKAEQEGIKLYKQSKVLLQNIQNIHNSKKLDPPKDILNMMIDESKESENRDTFDNSDFMSDDILENGPLECEDNLDILFEELAGSNNRKIIVNEKHFLPNRQQIPVPDFTTDSVVRQVIQQPSEDLSETEPTGEQSNIMGIRRRGMVQIIMDVTSSSFDISLTSTNVSHNCDMLNAVQSLDAFIDKYGLDKKQAAAFNIICSTFMLTYLEEYAASNTDVFNKESIENAKKSLIGRGATTSLKMMLTGKGGGGKSHVIAAVESFCKYFCNATNQHYSSSVFIITASTNSAAVAINGKTIHSVAQLNCSKADITSDICDVLWSEARIIIIDEISMLSIQDWYKMDRNLRDLLKQAKGISGKVYGGMNMVFSGDFFQLNPVGGLPVYISEQNIYWDDIDKCIILDGNHRFKRDHVWGGMLERLRIGQSTEEDIKLFNTRVVGTNGLKIPTRDELNGECISYCCKTNRMRNVVSDSNFMNILNSYHPKQGNTECAPNHTIIIKGVIADADGTIRSDFFHNGVFNECGDADIKASGTEKVDSCLKLYVGCPIMVSISDFKSTHGVVKGSTGKFSSVVFREGCGPKEEIWSGYKVLTANATDIDYIICEKYKKKPQEEGEKEEPTEYFTLPFKTFRVRLSLPLGSTRKIYPEKSTLKLTQFPININVGTTCHKLQGATKSFLVVTEFDYATENWIYVALSRVKTLSGLFLLKPINFQKIRLSQKLLKEMESLEKREKLTLDFLARHGNYV